MICCFLLTNFRVTYFAKTKIPTPTKKNRISHWRYSLFWCRVMQGNKLKLYPIWPKKLGFFWRLLWCCWCEIYWNGEKKFCAIRQRRLWKPLCCDLYPELYWNLLWELWDMLCPLKKRKKSVVCLQSQVNKTADCETAADIVQKKLNRRISLVPPYLPAIVYFFLWKQKLKKIILPSFRRLLICSCPPPIIHSGSYFEPQKGAKIFKILGSPRCCYDFEIFETQCAIYKWIHADVYEVLCCDDLTKKKYVIFSRVMLLLMRVSWFVYTLEVNKQHVMLWW